MYKKNIIQFIIVFFSINILFGITINISEVSAHIAAYVECDHKIGNGVADWISCGGENYCDGCNQVNNWVKCLVQENNAHSNCTTDFGDLHQANAPACSGNAGSCGNLPPPPACGWLYGTDGCGNPCQEYVACAQPTPTIAATIAPTETPFCTPNACSTETACQRCNGSGTGYNRDNNCELGNVTSQDCVCQEDPTSCEPPPGTPTPTDKPWSCVPENVITASKASCDASGNITASGIKAYGYDAMGFVVWQGGRGGTKLCGYEGVDGGSHHQVWFGQSCGTAYDDAARTQPQNMGQSKQTAYSYWSSSELRRGRYVLTTIINGLFEKDSSGNDVPNRQCNIVVNCDNNTFTVEDGPNGTNCTDNEVNFPGDYLSRRNSDYYIDPASITASCTNTDVNIEYTLRKGYSNRTGTIDGGIINPVTLWYSRDDNRARVQWPICRIWGYPNTRSYYYRSSWDTDSDGDDSTEIIQTGTNICWLNPTWALPNATLPGPIWDGASNPGNVTNSREWNGWENPGGTQADINKSKADYSRTMRFVGKRSLEPTTFVGTAGQTYQVEVWAEKKTGSCDGYDVIDVTCGATTPTPTPTPLPATYTISGNTYIDNNCNNVRDAGDPGYDGAQINLTGASTQSRTTAGGGNYTFATLSTGNYTVSVTAPAGYTAPIPSQTFNLASNATANFPLCPVRTISGSLYKDFNKNGVRDAGENTLFNDSATITLKYANTGGVVNTMTTSSGLYTFSNIGNGKYSIEVNAPGYANNPYVSIVDVSFANVVQDFMIQGFQFIVRVVNEPDPDTRDGDFDPGESPYAGAPLSVTGGNYVNEPGFTLANGLFTYTFAKEGSYTLSLGAITNFAQVFPVDGSGPIDHTFTIINSPTAWNDATPYGFGVAGIYDLTITLRNDTNKSYNCADDPVGDTLDVPVTLRYLSSNPPYNNKIVTPPNWNNYSGFGGNLVLLDTLAANDYSLELNLTSFTGYKVIDVSLPASKLLSGIQLPLFSNLNVIVCLSNVQPWFQTTTGDVKMRAIKNIIPNTSPPRYASEPGSGQDASIFISSVGTSVFTPGEPSDDSPPPPEWGWRVDNEYSTAAKSAGKGGGMSYDFFDSLPARRGITIQSLQALQPGCASPSNCVIAGLTTGIYRIIGDVTITSYTHLADQQVVILSGKNIDGTGGNIRIKLPTNSQLIVPSSAQNVLIFAAQNNIIFDKTTGNSSPIPETPTVDGVFAANNDVIADGDGCILVGIPDNRLNIAGAIIANAANPFAAPGYGGSGNGKFDNRRSLCADDKDTPSVKIITRPDFIINGSRDNWQKNIHWTEVKP